MWQLVVQAAFRKIGSQLLQVLKTWMPRKIV